MTVTHGDRLQLGDTTVSGTDTGPGGVSGEWHHRIDEVGAACELLLARRAIPRPSTCRGAAGCDSNAQGIVCGARNLRPAAEPDPDPLVARPPRPQRPAR